MTGEEATRRVEITDEIQAVKAEAIAAIRAARAEAVQARRRGAYWWAVMVLTAVMGPALAILVSAQNTHRSERQLCGVIAQADDAWKAAKPTTPSGRAQAASMAKLRRDYGCA